MATYASETVNVEFASGKRARYGYRSFGSGEGTPLVLLHRFRGTLDDWDPLLLDLLAAERRVIAFDNVGVGNTDGTAPDSIAEMADGVVDFLDALGLSQVDLLGWSMGGFVAQLVALNYPDRVAKLVVAGSGPGEPSVRPAEDERSLSIRPKADPSIEEILYLFFPDNEDGIKAGYEVLGRMYHHESGVVATTKEESWRQQAVAINKWNSGEDSAWSRLGELSVPTFVANGSQDIMEHPVQTYEMANRLPDGVITLFSGSGHAFLFQFPNLFAKFVHEFLD